jgi:hypothetical protein
MPYSADPPRDEAGKWTETGAENAGKAADEASRQADERDEELGSASGYNRHHGEAAGLYKTAAEHSRGVAAQHLAAGNAVAAARYEAEAKKRDSMAERHGAAADQKLDRLIEQKSGLGAWASKTARGKVIKSSSNGKSGLDKWASAGTDAVPF